MEQEQAVTNYDEQLPAEVIDTMKLDGAEDEDFSIWAKATPDGFQSDGNLSETIVGRITEVTPHWIRWVDNKPERSYEAEPPSEAYERRCDISVAGRNGFTVNLSLPRTSYRNLRRYFNFLEADGLNIRSVLTELSCKEVNGKLGTFTVVNFVLKSLPSDDIPF